MGQIINQFSHKVFHGIKFLQVEQFAFEQAKNDLHESIVQTVLFPAYALSDILLLEHPLVLACVGIVHPARNEVSYRFQPVSSQKRACEKGR